MLSRHCSSAAPAMVTADGLAAAESLHLRKALVAVGKHVAARFSDGLAVFQVWLAFSLPPSCPTACGEVVLTTEPGLGMASNAFASFRRQSCQSPMRYKDGLPARVWHSGACQVVQSLSLLPATLHPRTRLQGQEIRRLSEALYVPIFDSHRPHPLAVLEIFMVANAQSMLIADLISCVEAALRSMGLSVSSPAHHSPPGCSSASPLGLRNRHAKPVPDSAEDVHHREQEQGRLPQSGTPEPGGGGGAAGAGDGADLGLGEESAADACAGTVPRFASDSAGDAMGKAIGRGRDEGKGLAPEVAARGPAAAEQAPHRHKVRRMGRSQSIAAKLHAAGGLGGACMLDTQE